MFSYFANEKKILSFIFGDIIGGHVLEKNLETIRVLWFSFIPFVTIMLTASLGEL